MIRKNQLLYILIFLTAVGFTSCSKYLDKKPDNLLSDDDLWKTRANAEGYLANIYSAWQTGDYANVGASDEMSCAIPTVNVRMMVSGNWNSSGWMYYNWGAYYAAIRKSYIFEQNIDKVPSEQLSSDLKLQYKSEAIFLRGYYYWMLLRQYGPFVKVDGLLSQDEDYHQYARYPFDSCVSYINEILDQAAPGLPYVFNSAGNNGRVTRGAAYAVKSQVAMWAASPLWNGNTRFANFKNQDGTPLAPSSYDENKWRIAAKYSKAIIDSGHYKLYTSDNPYKSVRELFLNQWSEETIMASITWGFYSWVACSSPGPGGINMYNPTQNVVDAFRMKDGKEISDPTSSYKESGFVTQDGSNYWEQKSGDWNMYADREPRFYASICYNGRPVIAAVTVDDKNFYSSAENLDGRGRVEFYFSGKSGQSSVTNRDLTGYLPAKYISPDDNIRSMGWGSYRMPWIFIRYAEILLNYVEALNEYDPGNPDIVTYLNQVRERGGLPGIETVYPDAVGNKEKMRQQILRERQVEFAFEGDRYYTTIRRQILGNPENQNIYSMNVLGDDKGLGFGYKDFYKRTLFQKRFWNDRMYIFPIQQQDITRDRALVQNPGW